MHLRPLFCLCVIFLCACSSPKQDLGTLLSRFESEHDLEAQKKALRELYGRYHEAAGPGLLAISSLGEMEFQEAGPFVVGCLRDQDLKVKEAAALALSRIKDPDSVPPLVELLKDERDPAIIRYAASALANQGSPSTIPALKLRVNDGTLNTRLAVISAIGVLGSRQEAPYVATFLDDKEPFVAIAAARMIEDWSGQNFTWCGKNPCGVLERIEMAKKWWKAHAAEWK
jgi:hypothetical protein